MMKRALAAALALVAMPALVSAATRAASTGGVPVLMYHLVDARVPPDAVGRDLTVEPAAFDAQMRYLRDHHIATLTAEDFTRRLARGEHPQRAVVLTFDDGYEDAATVATPILARYGERATFFVSAGFVGTPRHMSWRQLRAVRRLGMEPACHGTFHLDLSTLDRAGQSGEIVHCAQTLQRYLGVRPVSYAYAAGKYDTVTFSVLAGAGFHAAFTEHPGIATDTRDPYEMPRRRIHHDDSLATFAALATP